MRNTLVLALLLTGCTDARTPFERLTSSVFRESGVKATACPLAVLQTFGDDEMIAGRLVCGTPGQGGYPAFRTAFGQEIKRRGGPVEPWLTGNADGTDRAIGLGRAGGLMVQAIYQDDLVYIMGADDSPEERP